MEEGGQGQSCLERLEVGLISQNKPCGPGRLVQAWLGSSVMLSGHGPLLLFPQLSSQYLPPQGLGWLPNSGHHTSLQRGRKKIGQTPELQSPYVLLMDTSSVLP